MFVWM